MRNSARRPGCQAGDDAAKTFVDSQNLHRRHLTADFRRRRTAELRAEGKSTREIAAELGVSHTTVRNDLNSGGKKFPPEPAGDGAPDEPATVQGRDGKQYAATLSDAAERDCRQHSDHDANG